MKIIIEVSHPKHVHLWKNIVYNLLNNGHEVKILAVEKDITLYLLKIYKLEYHVIGKHQKGLLRKALGLIKNDYQAYKISQEFKPDILISGTSLAHVSKLIGKPHIGFTDTENAVIAKWLSFPFSDVICTPSCYKGKIEQKKHLKYNGYEELAYLHPNYFKPDSSVLDHLGLDKDDKFVIIRFVSWEASHDMGEKGFIDKIKLIRSLEHNYKVFISSEKKLSVELKKYILNISPEKIHHALYYAHLFIGESSSMAAESAVLGTPSIFVSTSRRGYTDELESKYDLLYTFSNSHNAQENAVEKAIKLLEDNEIKNKWQKKREKLLNEKIDVTKFMTDFIEGYPNTFNKK